MFQRFEYSEGILVVHDGRLSEHIFIDKRKEERCQIKIYSLNLPSWAAKRHQLYPIPHGTLKES